MDSVLVVINNDVRIPLGSSVLRAIPLLNEKLPTVGPIYIEVPFVVSFRHIAVLAKIICNIRPIPMIDVSSHRDLYIAIKLADHLGVGDIISRGFNGWVENKRWVDLYDAEYIYPVFQLNEDLVDFKKFFRLHNAPLEAVRQCGELYERWVKNSERSPEEYIDMLLFFKNYNFSTCFFENTQEVQARIEYLEKGRSNIWKTFMVNPHELGDYFKYTPAGCDVWSCDGISSVPRHKPNECTLAPFDVALNNLTKFTHNCFSVPLNKSLGDCVTFPHDNVIFAGGAVSKLLSTNYSHKNARQSDVDIFIVAERFSERSKMLERVLDWFDTSKNTPRTYYAIRGSVISIYVKNIARKFQIISINNTNPYSVINRFDMSHVQWCYTGGKFFGTPEACKALREKITRFTNVRNLRINRLIKALHCGYDIYKDKEVIDNHTDLTLLLTDNDSTTRSLQLQKMIRDLYGFWYPKDEPDMDADELEQHILCQIEKDSNANLVGTNTKFVFDNIIIGGNFDNGYESILYTTFNLASVINKPPGRLVNRITPRTKYGPVRLSTGIITCVNVIVGAEGVTITAQVDEQFIEFCALLENQLFRIFIHADVDKHIVDENNRIILFLSRYQVTGQEIRGITYMKSQRGEPLNIEEDLTPGDEFQVTFTMDVSLQRGNRQITLKPCNFIKYIKNKDINTTTGDHIIDNVGNDTNNIDINNIDTGNNDTGDNDNIDNTEINYDTLDIDY